MMFFDPLTLVMLIPQSHIDMKNYLVPSKIYSIHIYIQSNQYFLLSLNKAKQLDKGQRWPFVGLPVSLGMFRLTQLLKQQPLLCQVQYLHFR